MPIKMYQSGGKEKRDVDVRFCKLYLVGGRLVISQLLLIDQTLLCYVMFYITSHQSNRLAEN